MANNEHGRPKEARIIDSWSAAQPVAMIPSHVSGCHSSEFFRKTKSVCGTTRPSGPSGCMAGPIPYWRFTSSSFLLASYQRLQAATRASSSWWAAPNDGKAHRKPSAISVFVMGSSHLSNASASMSIGSLKWPAQASASSILLGHRRAINLTAVSRCPRSNRTAMTDVSVRFSCSVRSAALSCIVRQESTNCSISIDERPSRSNCSCNNLSSYHLVLPVLVEPLKAFRHSLSISCMRGPFHVTALSGRPLSAFRVSVLQPAAISTATANQMLRKRPWHARLRMWKFSGRSIACTPFIPASCSGEPNAGSISSQPARPPAARVQ